MSTDPFAPLSSTGSSKATDSKPTWTTVMPVPSDAPPPPAAHPTLGKPSATWTYTDATGAVLGYVHRFDTTAGEKVFRPVTY